ncbi:MAG: ATP-binding protein [Nitriliruptorales bacterium]
MAPDATNEQVPAGFVIGTEDATPLEFWVAVAPDHYLQLDDVVAVRRRLPDGRTVSIYGVVSQVRARHDGARFDADVFLVGQGLLPAEVSEAAQVLATRFEPEIYVPPRPGTPVVAAEGADREVALFFDGMTRKLPIGLSRDDAPLYANVDFLDGTRGAHVNISGVSGVATKTSYATFLLHAMFDSGVLGTGERNTKAVVFNVKGEDLLFLDYPNRNLTPEDHTRYQALGLTPGAFTSSAFFAPPRHRETTAPQVGSRSDGKVRPFLWTLADFCGQELLAFLFADAADERQQYTTTVATVTAKLKHEAVAVTDAGDVKVGGVSCRTFSQLVDVIEQRVMDEGDDSWRGRAIGLGTAQAFMRRLGSAVRYVEHIIRGDVPRSDAYAVRTDAQVTVVDIHNLNDRAQRFVVGVMLRRLFRQKEEQGTREPLTFVVLDELNKYAPREGTSPIKEILLDVAERGRSLGMILIGAQQTASEVSRRIIANSAIRVVGRLDSAEAARAEYAWLPTAQRQRATIVKPGTMLVSQPELPVPLVVEFPFPAWATRSGEADLTVRPAGATEMPDDPFDDLAPAEPAYLDADGKPLPF